MALKRLAEIDAKGGQEARRCLHLAADAVHHYFIQRELCGLRRHDDVIADLAIPPRVLARLGAR
ncbi:DUF6665 family protein [Nitratireductor sp. GISD-1A_MAKvit]|uniref:DUF6665 family protein n=1 Tax=Nitratireductor sp. GISD-1A_MAKvit TaxID=3234198 RepID=UPI0034652659